MHLAKKLVLTAVAVAMTGFISAPAQSATAHCPDHNSSDVTKVEVDGGPTVYVGKKYAGRTVCIKAGTRIAMVVVDKWGKVTNKTIKNRNGKPLGISYYVIYKKDCDHSYC